MRYTLTTTIGTTQFTSKFANAKAAEFARRLALQIGQCAFVTIDRTR